MTWHNTSHYIASNDVTITCPDPATDIKTSKHFTSKHKTSPPWNGRRLVHSKEMIWASRWSVALRTFYRQILSVLYSSYPFGNFRPRLVRALLVYESSSSPHLFYYLRLSYAHLCSIPIIILSQNPHFGQEDLALEEVSTSMMPNIARHPQPSNEMNQKIDNMLATWLGQSTCLSHVWIWLICP